MAERAQVTSVEAIESFRASLIVFLSKARPTLEEIAAYVTRTRSWLEHDQRNYWDKQMKLRARQLERAQQELFSAKMSKIQKATAAHELALHRAQRAIREAEAKQRLVQKWIRDLDNRTEPLVKQVDALHGFLTTDMAKAVAFLGEAIKALEAYAEITMPGVARGPAGEVVESDEQKPANEEGQNAQTSKVLP